MRNSASSTCAEVRTARRSSSYRKSPSAGLAVMPEYRSSGYGDQLRRHIEVRARKAGIKKLSAPRRYLKVLKPVSVTSGDKHIAVALSADPHTGRLQVDINLGDAFNCVERLGDMQDA